MSTINLERSSHHLFNKNPRFFPTSKIIKSCSLNCTSKLLYPGGSFCNLTDRRFHAIKAGSSSMTAVETTESADIFFKETFPLRRTVTVEGKISIRLDDDLGQDRRQLTVGCTLPGKWTLHWGVNYVHEIRSEWDQPPPEMLPPGTIPIKDFAVESPLKNLSSTLGEDTYHEVKIDIDPKSEIAAINFVLKDEITGAWHQHNGRDFKIALVDYLQEDSKVVGTNKGFGLGRGDLANGERHSEGFYKEHSIVKQVAINNSLSVSVRKCPETSNNMLYLETDIPGDVVVHWGVCRSDAREWEIPATPHPPKTELFKKKALQTLLELKEGGCGSQGLFTVDEEFVGFLFVLKLNGNVWLRCMGNDFYVPLSFSCNLPVQSRHHENTSQEKKDASEEASHVSYTDGIINEIRNLVAGISSEKKLKTRTKQAQESILHEIEKLAAEAYSIFRKSVPTFSEAGVLDSKDKKPLLKFSSGTGSGFEILCQGFNWESHKSGKWYVELKERAPELSSLGFTVVWLPPPTESVSPEGYMPKDLYNLNSRYGTIGELKVLVNCFHELGIKVLGDAVLNHRCAHYQNQNGVWNIFGGQLNWDDRAVVADDPHFQGRGNKSSGDNFHAAPNIDHSQEFVRKDIKEWLCWLRKEIGYDGWRLDFVRGFWGGYVKDYMDASEPYFAVGEYWDSLSYTYGEMDHNQDAHRQRIIDWINATNGTAGAFDVTTKGVLHSALERCEYWRLSDEKGKPPGVVGWWPSRAVTFIENHDTGSTQGHWRFPRGKEMQGYAYILTHPGTPAVFYDHVLSHYHSEISSLLSLRNRNRLHCRSTVKIIKAERDVYAAVIDEKVTMKIGPGYFEPPSGSKRWRCAIEGGDYKVWELEES